MPPLAEAESHTQVTKDPEGNGGGGSNLKPRFKVASNQERGAGKSQHAKCPS